MTQDEFRTYVEDNPELLRLIKHAFRSANESSKSFSGGDAALILMMWPTAHFVISQVLVKLGLPWLSVLESYSELYRHKAERYIDEKYKAAGIDRDAARLVSEKLISEIAATKDAHEKKQWENLFQYFDKTNQNVEPDPVSKS